MIEKIFVTQRTEDGSTRLGYRSQWNPAKENRDPVEEARKIRDLNQQTNPLQAVNFPAFFIHKQQYDEPTSADMKEARMPEVGKYLGSTEPEKLTGV